LIYQIIESRPVADFIELSVTILSIARVFAFAVVGHKLRVGDELAHDVPVVIHTPCPMDRFRRYSHIGIVATVNGVDPTAGVEFGLGSCLRRRLHH
jgi:hypothetical protein